MCQRSRRHCSLSHRRWSWRNRRSPRNHRCSWRSRRRRRTKRSTDTRGPRWFHTRRSSTRGPRSRRGQSSTSSRPAQCQLPDRMPEDRHMKLTQRGYDSLARKAGGATRKCFRCQDDVARLRISSGQGWSFVNSHEYNYSANLEAKRDWHLHWQKAGKNDRRPNTHQAGGTPRGYFDTALNVFQAVPEMCERHFSNFPETWRTIDISLPFEECIAASLYHNSVWIPQQTSLSQCQSEPVPGGSSENRFHIVSEKRSCIILEHFRPYLRAR